MLPAADCDGFATQGGILCFSFSASSAGNSSTSNQSAYSENSELFTHIRIPGPQIIGWIMEVSVLHLFTVPGNVVHCCSLSLQCTPADNSVETYTPMDGSQFKVDMDSKDEIKPEPET